MLVKNEIKNLRINGPKEIYDKINEKILFATKNYFYLIKNHSYELSQIENTLNSYYRNSNIKIKQLLDCQQDIIKYLVETINSMNVKINSEKSIENIISRTSNNKNYNKYKNYCQTNHPYLNTTIENNSNCDNYCITNNNINSNIETNTNINFTENDCTTSRIMTTTYPYKSTNNNIKNNLRYDSIYCSDTLNSNNNNFSNNINIGNNKTIIPLNIIIPKNNIEYNGAISFFDFQTSLNNRKNIYSKFINAKNSNNNNKKNKHLNKSSSTKCISSRIDIYNNNSEIPLNRNRKYNSLNNSCIYFNQDTYKNIDIPIKESIRKRGHNNHSLPNYFKNNNYIDIPNCKGIKSKKGNGGEVHILLTNSSSPNINIFEGEEIIPEKSKYESTRYLETKPKEIYEKFGTVSIGNNRRQIYPSRFTKDILNCSYKKIKDYEKKYNK